MNDIHCHLLFNIDDGSKSIEESISILKDMESVGYKNIIITPHYIHNSKYNSTKDSNLKLLEILKKELLENNININLYLGNEVYIDEEILTYLNNNIISTLNNSKYILIELPMSGEYTGYMDIFNGLLFHGYKVILAHPERYYSFQKDFNKVYELVNKGIYLQSNLDSIIGGYGKDAKKMMKRLLKEKLITFLATDIHHKKSDYTKWEKAHKKALKYLSNDEYNQLVDINPEKVINDLDI